MPVYLKYGSIKGDVKEPAHRDWIELMSAQLGVQSVQYGGGGTGRGTGRYTPNEIMVTKHQDNASPLLFQEALTGKGTFVTIEFVKDDTVYLRLEMTETLISSFNVSGGGDRPTESLTLHFEKVVYTQIPGDPAK